MTRLRKYVSLAALAWFLVSIIHTCPLLADAKEISIVFRCDDYSSLSDTEFELRLIDVFRRHQLPIIMAVIPYIIQGDAHNPSTRSDDVVPLTGEKAAILKNAVAEGVVEVALHGYSHQSRIVGRFTEFRGMDYAEQHRRIAEGRDLLERLLGGTIHIFVPPWDRYDATTLRVLQEERFDILSADCYDAADVSGKLAYVPATATLENVREAVQAATRDAEPSPVIVVLFHNFDFQEAKNHLGTHTLAELFQLLDWLKSQPNLRVTTLTDAANRTRGLPPERLLAIHEFLDGKELRLLPTQVASRFSILAFPVPDGDLATMKAQLWATLIAFWGAVVAVVVGIGYAITRRLRLRLLTMKWVLFGTSVWAVMCLAGYLLTLSSGPRFHVAFFAAVFVSMQLGVLAASRVQRDSRKHEETSEPRSPLA